jgi:hypothetical protein
MSVSGTLANGQGVSAFMTHRVRPPRRVKRNTTACMRSPLDLLPIKGNSLLTASLRLCHGRQVTDLAVRRATGVRKPGRDAEAALANLP